MNIRIGIVQSMKEIDVELDPDSDADALTAEVERALAGDGVLWLTDRRGRKVGVPASRVAYVEVAPSQTRVVGFGAAWVLDYHLHLWPHDRSSVWYQLDQVAAYCEEAARHGVTELALTEHANRFRDVMDLAGPFWEGRDDETARAMAGYFEFTSRNSLADYVELACLAQAEGLPVKVGLEVDYVRGRMDVLSDYYAQFPFDVLIGSVHWLGTWAFDDVDVPATMREWEARDVDGAWDEYTGALEELAATDSVDVLAHPDLIKVAGYWPGDPGAFWDRMADAAAGADVSMECSSAGWVKPVGEQYPSAGLIERLVARGVTFTTASDAHDLERVGERTGDLADLLEAHGVTTLAAYHRRERVNVALRA